MYVFIFVTYFFECHRPRQSLVRMFDVFSGFYAGCHGLSEDRSEQRFVDVGGELEVRIGFLFFLRFQTD